MHVADVAVVQLLLAQSARASMAVAVASVGAKFVPISVTLAMTETTLYGDDAVKTGASMVTKTLEGNLVARCARWLGTYRQS